MSLIGFRPEWTAVAISGPIAAALAAAQIGGSAPIAHGAAMAVVVLSLPWVVPAFVAVAVLSAPAYVALHFLGHPVALAPWLSTVVLLAAVSGCHANAVLLLKRLASSPLSRSPAHGGLADFLRSRGEQGRQV